MKIKYFGAMLLFICIGFAGVSNELAGEIMIRSLVVDDWENFRNLRLKALVDSPKAYGIALEDEAGKSDEEWKCICDDASNGKGKWYFVAEFEGKLIGMLGAAEIFGRHMRHQVEICSAFVEEPFRGKGILTKLYLALKSQLQLVPHLEQMIVWVTLHESQTSKNVFEKFGFRYAGRLSKTVKFEGQYYDCCWLEAKLSP